MTSKELICNILDLIKATECLKNCRFDIDNDLLFIEGTYRNFGHTFNVMIGFYNDYTKINFCVNFGSQFKEYQTNIDNGINEFEHIIRSLTDDFIFDWYIA